VANQIAYHEAVCKPFDARANVHRSEDRIPGP
jgi:hypothetical protein